MEPYLLFSTFIIVAFISIRQEYIQVKQRVIKMTVLVTNDLGYIGSNTVCELLEKKYDVVVIDDLSNSSERVLVR